ncbi:hypothetical protein ATO6_17530 [Oceanicola sp. 22II-s10i]|uniref:endonuclease n=1 Tax=Oceanicola sp. 22II-s10i TaxID=1317116 RepID=UPI000B679466|nr:endonuclease [Oceanicola sp. 22II-s10i]OWU83662.1 hypothetical protein ATO6_17530 [Oceanicola sp. 22II-s10i]
MDMSTKEGRCAAISWIAGAVIAILAYVLMRPGVWILLALVIAVIVGIAAAVMILRIFCASGEVAESDPADRSMDAVPAPMAAPAPGASAATAAASAPTGLMAMPEDEATAEWDDAQEGASTAATSAAAFDAEAEMEAEDDGASEVEAMPDIADSEDPVDAGADIDDPAEPDAGLKPEGLAAAREGGADDLKRIKGVGPKLEDLLHELGIFHFDQIAGWTASEVAWMDDNLKGFKGRVTRDDWIAQAKVLAEGGATEFSGRVDKGGVY